jgi:mannose-6-phosphate isomerase-like protein (cupin superfamily)
MQLVVMCLQSGEEIGLEVHDHIDQFIRVEQGDAKVTLGPAVTRCPRPSS